MRRSMIKAGAGLAAVAAIGAGAVGIANASGGSSSGAAAPSRMDDGKNLLRKAGISESQAIAAARTAASGDLNEVDLEHARGRLVFNVDVGSHDVHVDAQSGKVVDVRSDD